MKVCVVAGAQDGELEERCAAVCAAAGIELVAIDPWMFDFSNVLALDDGDVLLRLDMTASGARVERYLFRPGLRTLHRTPLGPLQVINDPAFHLHRAGVPLLRPWPVTQLAPSVLSGAVEHLGGFPVVVSGHGACVGTGALVAWSDADLVATVRHFASEGKSGVLFAYPPAGELWRVTVLDEALLVCAHEPWDGHPATVPCFDDPTAFTTAVPGSVQRLASQVAMAMGLRAVSVDVLDVEGADPLVIDVRFPLDLAELFDVGEAAGIDVLARVLEALCGVPLSAGRT
jgi:hypothetical protein